LALSVGSAPADALVCSIADTLSCGCVADQVAIPSAAIKDAATGMFAPRANTVAAIELINAARCADALPAVTELIVVAHDAAGTTIVVIVL